MLISEERENGVKTYSAIWETFLGSRVVTKSVKYYVILLYALVQAFAKEKKTYNNNIVF